MSTTILLSVVKFTSLAATALIGWLGIRAQRDAQGDPQKAARSERISAIGILATLVLASVIQAVEVARDTSARAEEEEDRRASEERHQENLGRTERLADRLAGVDSLIGDAQDSLTLSIRGQRQLTAELRRANDSLLVVAASSRAIANELELAGRSLMNSLDGQRAILEGQRELARQSSRYAYPLDDLNVVAKFEYPLDLPPIADLAADVEALLAEAIAEFGDAVTTSTLWEGRSLFIAPLQAGSGRMNMRSDHFELSVEYASEGERRSITFATWTPTGETRWALDEQETDWFFRDTEYTLRIDRQSRRETPRLPGDPGWSAGDLYIELPINMSDSYEPEVSWGGWERLDWWLDFSIGVATRRAAAGAFGRDDPPVFMSGNVVSFIDLPGATLDVVLDLYFDRLGRPFPVPTALELEIRTTGEREITLPPQRWLRNARSPFVMFSTSLEVSDIERTPGELAELFGPSR